MGSAVDLFGLGKSRETSLFDRCRGRLDSDLRRIGESSRAMQREAQIATERKQKAELATIELNGKTKEQNELLKAQLEEIRSVNTQIAKQSNESSQLAKIAIAVSIVSAIISVLMNLL